MTPLTSNASISRYQKTFLGSQNCKSQLHVEDKKVKELIMGGAGSDTSPPRKKYRSFSMYEGPDFELKCINSIRALSADMPSAAKSGHPGAPMGCAPLAHLLWSEVMNYSPVYELTMEDLKQFRQLGSLTPGHPCLNIQCP